MSSGAAGLRGRRLGPTSLLLGVLSSGCALRAPEIRSLELTEAELVKVETQRASALIGGVWMQGVIWAEDSAGERHRVPVRGGGVSVGLLCTFGGISRELPWRRSQASAQVPEGTLGRELFGRYEGTGRALQLAYGVEQGAWSNEAGVTLEVQGASMGVGLWLGHDRIWLRPDPRRARREAREQRRAEREAAASESEQGTGTEAAESEASP